MLRHDLIELDSTKKLLEEETKKTSVLGAANEERILQVLYVYKAMQYLTKNQKRVKVSYKMNDPFKGMGVVSVIGENVKFSDNQLYEEAIMLANNFEVYPKVNGTIQINFTFYGILNKK